MIRRPERAGMGTGALVVMTLVGVLAAATACSSGESSGDDGDAGDPGAD